MGELTDKIKGNVNEAIGKVKQAVADSHEPRNDAETHDQAKLKAEGAGQELKGKGEQFTGKVKGALGNDI